MNLTQDSVDAIAELTQKEREAGPFILYHWSPRSRHGQIEKYGLRPGSRARYDKWNPPYICFCASPSAAWGCLTNKEEGEWDLWMVWSGVPSGYEILPTYGADILPEYRVYERIYKRDIWYVGTRVLQRSRDIRK